LTVKDADNIFRMKVNRNLIRSLLLVLVIISITGISIGPVAAKKTSSKASFTISNPHKNYKYNFKGNLHAHSTNSPDSTEPVTSVTQWYKDNGYYFYSITDHDYVTADPGVSGITWLGSSEEDTSDGSSGHIGHINIATPITSGIRQDRVNNAINQGGFSILNHPSRSSGGFGEIHIADLEGVSGMEVFNGKENNATTKWDPALTYGKVIWGFANDDAHKDSQRGTAYNVVNSNSSAPTKEQLISQIKAGNFYASSAFDIRVTVSGKTITAQTTNGAKIKWVKQFGEVIKTIDGKKSSYSPKGGEKYIRVEALDENGTPKAWSQPLFIHKENREFLDLQVSSGADDGGYSAGNSYSNQAGFVEIGNLGSNTGLNARFASVNINKKAPISKAYLILGENTSAKAGKVAFKVTGAKEASSGRIGSTSDWQARPRTQKAVNWTDLPQFTIRDWSTSPDIKDVIQEIINQPGWKKGNALQLFVEDNGSDAGSSREFMLREHSTYPVTGAARLVIYFDSYKPKTYAPRKYVVKRKGKRKLAKARFYWKVYDPYAGGKAYVKLKIKKRVRSRYRNVKIVNYGLTTINKLRFYRLSLKTPGIYKYYVLARDKAGNKQRNSASNFVIVK